MALPSSVVGFAACPVDLRASSSEGPTVALGHIWGVGPAPSRLLQRRFRFIRSKANPGGERSVIVPAGEGERACLTVAGRPRRPELARAGLAFP
jgi:hypothetical protein